MDKPQNKSEHISDVQQKSTHNLKLIQWFVGNAVSCNAVLIHQILSRSIAQKVSFGIIVQHCNLPHLKPPHMLVSAERQNLTGYPVTYK